MNIYLWTGKIFDTHRHYDIFQKLHIFSLNWLNLTLFPKSFSSLNILLIKLWNVTKFVVSIGFR